MPLITEDHPQNPVEPDRWSKLMIDQMPGYYARTYSLRYAAVRYFDTAGAGFDLDLDPNGEISRDLDPGTYLIPLAICAAQDGEPLWFFGTDYDTPDGTTIGDYVHVTNLANGHLRALGCLEARGATRAQLRHRPQPLDSRYLIAPVEAASAGRKVLFVEPLCRAGEPPDLLHWWPRYKALKTSVAMAVAGTMTASKANGVCKGARPQRSPAIL